MGPVPKTEKKLLFEVIWRIAEGSLYKNNYKIYHEKWCKFNLVLSITINLY